MTRLLHLRSIRAAIARGERRKAKLLDQLLELENEIDELLAKLPAAERAAIEEARRTIPDQWGIVIKPDTYEQVGGYIEPPRDVGTGVNPDADEQGTLDCGAPECPWHHGGNAPYCPLAEESWGVEVEASTSAEPAEQASGTARSPEVDDVTLIDAAAQSRGTDAPPLMEQDIRDAVDKMKAMPELQMPPVLVVPLADLANVPPRKPGWPAGLSRKLTPCDESPIPHRHQTEGDWVTCVNIRYPEKAATP